MGNPPAASSLGPHRPCPICGGEPDSICEAAFAGIEGVSVCAGYVVATCKDCGFGFANHCPPQAKLDRYESLLRRYEGVGGSTFDAHAQNRTPHIAAEIAARVSDRRASILVSGRDGERLVAELGQLGFSNAVFADPSPKAECAEECDALVVETAPINLAEVSFDVVVIAYGLAHMRDVLPLIERVGFLLKPSGHLFVEVANALETARDNPIPFGEFGVHRFNYFSPVSLANLLGRAGFVSMVPLVQTRGWFIRSETKGGLVRDEDTRPALVDHVARSRERDAEVRARIADIVRDGASLLVWGTGSEVLRLLATTDLSQGNIRGFVDANPRLHGATLRGVPVLPPMSLLGLPHPVLVGSTSFGPDIERRVRAMGCQNTVLRLPAMHA